MFSLFQYSLRGVFLRYRYLLLAPLFFFSVSDANAQCTRDDVDHYLSKGFTPAQIIQLCAVPVADLSKEENRPVIDLQADSVKPVDLNATVVTEPKSVTSLHFPPSSMEGVSQLQLYQIFVASIDADELQVSDADFKYSRTHCLEFGAKNQYGTTKTFCPMFDYSVEFKGLKVEGVEKLGLFSKKKIMTITGNIAKSVKGNEEFKYFKRRLVNAYLAETDSLKIPLKSGAPVSLLQQRLEELQFSH